MNYLPILEHSTLTGADWLVTTRDKSDIAPRALQVLTTHPRAFSRIHLGMTVWTFELCRLSDRFKIELATARHRASQQFILCAELLLKNVRCTHEWLAE
jgi:hypothetical protein